MSWMGSYIVKKRLTLVTPVRHSLKHDSTRTSRLARNSNPPGVSAKFSDVRLNPLKSKTLIQKTGIDLAILFNVFRREKAKCAESILNDDCNEAIVICVDQLTGIIDCAKETVTTSI